MKLLSLVLLLLSSVATANVEKTIFTAPSETKLSDSGPRLENLCLDSLLPSRGKLRTELSVVFPNENNPRGLQSWFLLNNLKAGQRYEVRICWSATQPTDFHLSTFSMETVFNNETLITGLAAYAEQRQGDACPSAQSPDNDGTSPSKQSLLFLKIDAAADFFSSYESLMVNPPPVLVDIILDPYYFNVIPQSLLPIGAYILAVVVSAYYLSGFVVKWLLHQGSIVKDKDA